MAKFVCDWSLPQLAKLMEQDPHRAERLLEPIWDAFPSLKGELALCAVESGALTVSECAAVLCVSEAEVEHRLENQTEGEQQTASLILVNDGVARLADARVTVWEIVRELRRQGSVDSLCETYPGLTRTEMEAALSYADANRDEIEVLIVKYEDMLARKKTEYPYAK